MHLALLQIFLCFPAHGAPARDDSIPHGRVELISEDKWIQPGRPFQAGLRFALENGWHIYWINSGDSGEPPRVQWSLPPGFKAGTIEWPFPKRLGSSSIVDYGYEGEVLLPVKIRPPSKLDSGEATLSAELIWLVCREICIPGNANLSLKIAIQNGQPPRNANVTGLFGATRARLPKPLPGGWKTAPVSTDHGFSLEIHTGKPEHSAEFFPLEAEQIENAAPQTTTPLGDGIRIVLKSSDKLLKPIARLRGVIVFEQKKAYLVDVPVRGSQRERGK